MNSIYDTTFYVFVQSRDGKSWDRYWTDCYDNALYKLNVFKARHENAVGSIMGMRLKRLKSVKEQH